MAGSRSTSSDAAERYAAAVFELALEAKQLDETERDLTAFTQLIAENDELRSLVDSPAFAADDKARAIAAVAQKAKMGDLARRFLGATAANGRARDILGAVRAFQDMAARHRGEITAEVAAPLPLTDAQQKALAAALKRAMGRDVAVRASVEPELLGGFTVKVGSRLFDASLRTKLNGLKAAMKGA